MRESFLPFARPAISEEAIAAVADSLRSGWITTGPKAQAFEEEFAAYTGAPFALALNSATAGLHLAFLALGLGHGDEVITTPMTFVATVNTILWTGARPVLVDIDRETLNIDTARLEAALTERTRAIVPVHFAGLPCDMDAVEAIAAERELAVVEDAAHALGARYKGRLIGSSKEKRHATVFSFHPTKNITTGEGGMLCTGDEEIAEKTALLRQHGMSKGAWKRYAVQGTPHYDVHFPGLKYNMLDIEAAIGRDQLRRLEGFNGRRREIAARYDAAFADLPGLILPRGASYDHLHSRHIYTPLVDTDALGLSRDAFMVRLREFNIGTALHYQAVHLFSYYGKTFGWRRGDFPEAEHVSDRIVSLPLFPAMTDDDVSDVIETVRAVCLSGGR